MSTLGPESYVTLPTSPEAAALGKFIESPVNRHTGVPSIGVPLHTAKSSGSLEVSVGLLYHASGVRPRELASWVGTGWALSAGGVVSRSIHGLPDDLPGAGYLDVADEISRTDDAFLAALRDGLKDSEQDTFSYSIPGYSGKFVLKSNGQVELIPRRPLKIEYSGKPILSFLITTPNGTRYLLGSSRIEGVQRAGRTRSCIQSSDDPCTNYTEMTWHLIQIESADRNHHIDFEYDREDYQYKVVPGRRSMHGSYGLQLEPGNPNNTGGGQNIQEPLNEGPAPSEAYHIVHIEGRRISKITTAFETIEFIPSTDRRKDVDFGAKRLDSIKISTGEFAKRWSFNHDYFKSSENDSELRSHDYHLRLTGLSLASDDGTDLGESYEFDYVKKDDQYYLPSSLTNAIDYWGYYNGKHLNDDSLINIPPTTMNGIACVGCNSDRGTDERAIKFGVLKRIRQPHGGTTEYEFEANRYQPVGLNPYLPPLVSTPPPSQLGESGISCALEGSCCGVHEGMTKYSLSEQQILRGFVRIKLSKDPDDDCDLQTEARTLFTVVNSTGQTVHIDGFELYDELSSEPGRQTVDRVIDIPFRDIGVQEGELYDFRVVSEQIRAQISLYEIGYAGAASDGQYPVGGLRVKEIRVSPEADVSNDQTMVRRYEYGAGVLFEEYPNFAVDLSDSYTCDNPCNLGAGLGSTLQVSAVGFSDQSVQPLTDASGYHVGYRSITEIHPENGKRTRRYHVDRSPGFDPKYPGVYPTPAMLENGRLLSTSDYSEDGVELANTERTLYPDPYKSIVSSNFRSRVFRVTAKALGSFQNSYFKHVKLPYYNRTRWVRDWYTTETKDGVTKTTERVYDRTVDHGHPYPAEIHTSRSDGQKQIQVFQYVTESESEVHQEMASRNMLQTIQEETFVGTQRIDGTRTTFQFLAGNGRLQDSQGSPFEPIVIDRIERDEQSLESGSNAPNWVEQIHFERYDTQAVRPDRIRQRGWNTEHYVWENGLIASRTLCKTDVPTGDCPEGQGLTTSFDYFQGTTWLESRTEPNGLKESYGYDDLGRLKSASARGGEQLRFFEYEFGDENSYGTVTTRHEYAEIPESGLSTQEQVRYLDGLGRPILDVQVGASDESQRDIAFRTRYDSQGRVVASYRPFEGSASDGSFVEVPDDHPHTFMTFEASPLKRVRSKTPPGWYATETSFGSNEDTVVLADGTQFEPNTLRRLSTTDPDGLTVTVFQDINGNQVFARKSRGGATLTETSKIFDLKDRQIKAYPEGANDSTPDLLFHFAYDGADRLKRRKIPGAEATLFWYDERGLQSFSQDGNQRDAQRYLHQRYNPFGQLVEVGLSVGDPGSGNSVRPIVDSWQKVHYVENPGPSIAKIDYQEDKLLDGSERWLETRFDYDEFGRVDVQWWQPHFAPLLRDYVQYSYDSADNVWREHSLYNQGVKFWVRTLTDIDAQGREKRLRHEVSGQDIVYLNELHFDVAEQITTRYLAGRVQGAEGAEPEWLQKVDYAYDPQGWLRAINPTGITGPAISAETCSLFGPVSLNVRNQIDRNDLFHMEVGYEEGSTALQATARLNGVPSYETWKVRGREKEAYAYSYDDLNRLESAQHWVYTGFTGVLQPTNRFSTSYGYDSRGNLEHISRRGLTQDGSCWSAATIDDLTLQYPAGSNQVETVADASGRPEGYDGSGAGTFRYDKNGNLIEDPVRGLTIEYNLMGLPTRLIQRDGTEVEHLYLGNGSRVRTTITRPGEEAVTRDYNRGAEYVNGEIHTVQHGEGRVLFVDGRTDQPRYEFSISDHLDRVRVRFSDLDGDGQIDQTVDRASTELLEEFNFYPFGMPQDGPWLTRSGEEENYILQGKEFERNTKLFDFGPRYFDSTLARFTGVDPLAHKMEAWSPYAYGFNAPTRFLDPTGMEPDPANGDAEENGDGETEPPQDEYDYSSFDEDQDDQPIDPSLIVEALVEQGWDRSIAEAYVNQPRQSQGMQSIPFFFEILSLGTNPATWPAKAKLAWKAIMAVKGSAAKGLSRLIMSAAPNTLARSEALRAWARQIPTVSKDGFFNVLVHGSPGGGTFSVLWKGEWRKLSHRSIGKWIESLPEYAGQNIRLITCFGSKCSRKGALTQNLANKMNVVVEGTPTKAWVTPQGKVFSMSYWKKFVPGGNVAKK